MFRHITNISVVDRAPVAWLCAPLVVLLLALALPSPAGATSDNLSVVNQPAVDAFASDMETGEPEDACAAPSLDACKKPTTRLSKAPLLPCLYCSGDWCEGAARAPPVSI